VIISASNKQANKKNEESQYKNSEEYEECRLALVRYLGLNNEEKSW
jgi:hypothetical protein